MESSNLYSRLNSLEKKFRKIKTPKGISNKFEFLTDENSHSEASLLLSIHYGSKKDVELIKELIIKQEQRPCPNRAYMKRIKITSGFYKIHRIFCGKAH